MLRAVTRALVPVVLAFVVGVSACGAASMTSVLVTLRRDTADRPNSFDSGIRRYTDRWVITAGGRFAHDRSRYPLIELVARTALWYGISMAAVVMLWRRLHLSRDAVRYTALVTSVLIIGMVLVFLTLKPYQRERVRIFLNPERDPLGSGYAARPDDAPPEPFGIGWPIRVACGSAGAVIGAIAYAVGRSHPTSTVGSMRA